MSNDRALQTLQGICLALVIGLLTGCASTSPISEIQRTDGFDVPWPGDNAPVRTASDDTITLLGNEYALIGGAATEDGTAVELSGSGELPFAVYTVGAFLAPLEFSKLDLDAVFDEATTGDGTQLYVGLANYKLNTWEWFAVDSGSWSTGPLDSASYASSTGTAGVAVVLDGPGSASVNSLTFSRSGDTTLHPPDPIYADPVVDRITISWDRVPVAIGYNVYRDEEPALPAPQKLNSELITKEFFDDRTVVQGVMYYYFVTAVGGDDESEPSMMLDVFAPEVNLFAPTNLRMIASTPTTATVAWDWQGAPPNKFYLYLDDLKDFNLITPIQSKVADGEAQQYTFYRLDFDTKYRWRICGYFGGRRGRMADDTLLLPIWDWGPAETVGNGTDTVVAIRANSDLAAAYYDTNVVNFARRTSGNWVEETVFDSELFDTYVDLAYGGGKFLVTGWSVVSGDMWVATGTPGNLTPLRIHGDGGTGLGHPNSGLGGVATATATEFVVAHTFVDQHTTLIQTRPISGGDWTTATLSTNAWIETPYNLASDGTNAYLLFKDINTNTMMFGDMNGGWEFAPALPEGSPSVYFNSDLVRFGNQWISPLRDATNELFIMAKGTETPWTIEELYDKDIGSGARLDAEGTRAGLVCTAFGRWWFAYTDDVEYWKFTEIRIPGHDITGRPDIVMLGGSPYIVFADGDTGKIRAVKGTPPEE